MSRWGLFKKLRVPTAPKGPRTVNIVFGYFFVINYIIGTGFLGIPYAFYHAGMLASIITLSVVSFLAWNTASWLIETMSRAQALETFKHAQMSNTTAEGDKDPLSSSKRPVPSSSQEDPQFEILLTRKFELTELCQVFVNKWFKVFVLVVMSTSSFLALWSYGTVGGSGWSTNLPLNFGPFRICTEDDFRGNLVPETPGCLASYRFCVFLFAVIVVPLSCLELKELGFVQAILGVVRFAIIGSIVLYCLAKLAESPLAKLTVPTNVTTALNLSAPAANATCPYSQGVHPSSSSSSVRNFVLDFSVVGWVLSIPVFTYAQILHPGIPSLTHPIKQKRGLHWFMMAIFGTTLFCYMVLGVAVSLWFQGDINETASLNWAPLTKPGHHAALRALSYFIVLFPTLDVISAYPLVTCATVNNLYQVIMGRDTSQSKHAYEWLVLLAMRVGVATLPVLCSLFVSNLVYILKYAGLMGFVTAILIPLVLQLSSQYKCAKVFGERPSGTGDASSPLLEPHVDTEMEVLKKDGEEEEGEGANLIDGSDDEAGKKKKKGKSLTSKGKPRYMTPYSIPVLSHPVTVVIIGLLGGAMFVISLVSLGFAVRPKCS